VPVFIIAAVSENRVIGRAGGLPWHLPADLDHFRRLTTGNALVMGRKTYESVGRPLPKRRCIVLSRDPSFTADGVEVAGSLEQALALCSAAEKVFIAGGSSVFAEAMGVAERIYLTVVHGRFEGDTLFPDVDFSAWKLTSERRRPADDVNAFAVSFRVYQRPG